MTSMSLPLSFKEGLLVDMPMVWKFSALKVVIVVQNISPGSLGSNLDILGHWSDVILLLSILHHHFSVHQQLFAFHCLQN